VRANGQRGSLAGPPMMDDNGARARCMGPLLTDREQGGGSTGGERRCVADRTPAVFLRHKPRLGVEYRDPDDRRA
jgi:hypothetical protein